MVCRCTAACSPAKARSGRAPASWSFPEAFGLGAHAIDRARRLAERGYVTLACDLHGESVVHDDFPTVMQLMGALQADPAKLQARVVAAFDALTARSEVDGTRIAAIGYCFGGTMALELARGGADIAGVVGFHSGLAPVGPAAQGGFAPKVLVCLGADDPSIGADVRNAFEAEMRGANVDWQMHVYGGVVHSFTNPEADSRGAPDFARYDATADARSWMAMIQFLDETFHSAGR